MKIRQAKKILNMMERGTDTRYFESKYTFKEESRFIPRLKNLYQKATIRWNKVNMPSANVSLFRSSVGKIINADQNGALNILRKVVGDSEFARIIGSGHSLCPVRHCNPFNRSVRGIDKVLKK